MARVIVFPSALEFEAKIGETLMAAAQARGLYWPTTCGGQGVCTTCLSEIVGGNECLAEMSRKERKTLAAERGEAIFAKGMRLACETAVVAEGEIRVMKAGVRGSDEIPGI